MKHIFLITLLIIGCFEYVDNNAIIQKEAILDFKSELNSGINKLSNDEIIKNKQISFNNQKLNAIFFPYLDTNTLQIYGAAELIIYNDIYYLLIKQQREDYVIINLENGKLMRYDKKKIDEIMRYGIIVPYLSHSQEAIFITHDKYLPYCKSKLDCRYFTDYDITYHFGNTMGKYSLVMQDTTYSPVRDIKKTLRLGFFSFSNTDTNPDYSSAKSIIIHNPSQIFVATGQSGMDVYKQEVVAADILSGISQMWKIDDRRRYLVRFGREHPFLFMVLDIERGLDIPENHLENIYFISYKTMQQKFGQFRNPISRAKQLSEWITQINIKNQ